MNLAELLDASEVAELLGLSSFRVVSVYRKRYEDFPKPIIGKGRCVLWHRPAVVEWARETGRIT